MDELEELRRRWLELIRRELPAAARTHPHWAVRHDHCFGRILLDNLCGQPWREALRPPAYKALSSEQLRAGIALGEAILGGDADLNALNQMSLRMRGKAV